MLHLCTCDFVCGVNVKLDEMRRVNVEGSADEEKAKALQKENTVLMLRINSKEAALRDRDRHVDEVFVRVHIMIARSFARLYSAFGHLRPYKMIKL